jgi:hypothetical protein
MEKNGDPEATQKVEARRAVEQSKLIALAERIAAGWAEQLKLGKDVVEWVAIKGRSRAPISNAGAEAFIRQMDNQPGIAFVLGCAGVMDLLFVVSCRGALYSVNISNNARPWERSECLKVRPDVAKDMHRLLAAAERYARRVFG